MLSHWLANREETKFADYEQALWVCQHSPAQIRGCLKELRDGGHPRKRGRPRNVPRRERPITDYQIDSCFRGWRLACAWPWQHGVGYRWCASAAPARKCSTTSASNFETISGQDIFHVTHMALRDILRRRASLISRRNVLRSSATIVAGGVIAVGMMAYPHAPDNEPGGYLNLLEERWRKLAESGDDVEIRGPCYSGCTVLPTL